MAYRPTKNIFIENQLWDEFKLACMKLTVKLKRKISLVEGMKLALKLWIEHVAKETK